MFVEKISYGNLMPIVKWNQIRAPITIGSKNSFAIRSLKDKSDQARFYYCN